MNLYFKFKELVIDGGPIPIDVAQKLLTYHIIPVSVVRGKLGVPMTASYKSGYRPYKWEISRGRNGKSQHVFEGKGAIDWTCKNFRGNKKELLELLVQHTEYTRFAVYNTFIHCDYKKTKGGRREIYTSTPSSRWTLKMTI